MILAVPDTVINTGSVLSLHREGEGVSGPCGSRTHDSEAHPLVLYLSQAFQYQCVPGHARRQGSRSAIPVEAAKHKRWLQRLASHVLG